MRIQLDFKDGSREFECRACAHDPFRKVEIYIRDATHSCWYWHCISLASINCTWVEVKKQPKNRRLYEQP